MIRIPSRSTRTDLLLPYTPLSRSPAGAPPGTPARRPCVVCNSGAENYARLQQFAGPIGTIIPNAAKNDYRYLLPSLNIRFGVTDDLLFRLAISRVMTRPDTAYVRHYLKIGRAHV